MCVSNSSYLLPSIYSKEHLHYSSFVPSLYIQVYARTCIYMSAHEHVLARIWRPDVNQSCHSSRASTFIREERSGHASTGRLAEQWRLQELVYCLLYGPGIASVYLHLWLLLWVLRSNSGPQVSMISTLWTLLAPCPIINSVVTDNQTFIWLYLSEEDTACKFISDYS